MGRHQLQLLTSASQSAAVSSIIQSPPAAELHDKPAQSSWDGPSDSLACHPTSEPLCLLMLCCCAGCSNGTNKQQQQPGNSRNSSSSLLHDPRVRVLLVGCCSQGSVAVWDVQLQQQIMALHSPDVSLAALLPVQPPVGPMLATASAAADVAGSSKAGNGAITRQQLQQPLLLLALVASRDSTATPPAAVAKAVSRIGSKTRGAQLSLAAAAAATESQQQQQPQLELRPVLLQQPGLLVPGAPILASAAAGVRFGQPKHEQLQQLLTSPGVSAAALSGTLAAAVGPGGFVNVWDVLSGESLLCPQQSAAGPACNSSRRAGELAAVQLVEFSSLQQQSSSDHGAAAGCVALMGSADGVLTCALV
jgi:hypothetical protein